MSENSAPKSYEVEGLSFEFTPNGSPLSGVLAVMDENAGTYNAEVSLQKIRSRKAYAEEAAKLYGFGEGSLRRALNEICTLRTAEVEAASRAAGGAGEAEEEEPPLSEEAEALVSSPGVLERYAGDVARIRGVIGDRQALRLQALVAFGAQLAPLPSGRPAGANLILTAEAGRGKNYICDAVAAALPEEFYFAFESASAKSLYYRAENDPEVLKHRWLYPNEAEAIDHLVEMARPLLSGGKASHLTVNKTGEGRNAAQELNIEGPASITIPTVRNKLDGQLQTRMLVAELPDYEGRVAHHSRAVSRQLLPDQAGKDHSPKVEAWRSALRALTEIRRVVFPLDTEEFRFDSDSVSHGARLWGNLLGLMLAHAWLEQRNREALELASGERAVVATPEDYAAAYAIFKETCERSVVNLSDTHRAILDTVHDLKALHKEESGFITEGFSHRKIAERASVHHSTIGEHRTFLVKSAKLLRETESGMLDLVADAEPSWWRGGEELLAGFPRPEQVRGWWEEREPSSPESARQARHPQEEGQNPDTYGENPGGQPIRQWAKATRHSPDEEPADVVADGKTAVAGEAPASENGLNKANTDASEPLAGVAGGFESTAETDPVSWDLEPGESATLTELRERRSSPLPTEQASEAMRRAQSGPGLALKNYARSPTKAALEYLTKAVLRNLDLDDSNWGAYTEQVRELADDSDNHPLDCPCEECV